MFDAKIMLFLWDDTKHLFTIKQFYKDIAKFRRSCFETLDAIKLDLI